MLVLPVHVPTAGTRTHAFGVNVLMTIVMLQKQLRQPGEHIICITDALSMIDVLLHPKNCSAAKYLLWIAVHHGIGEPFSLPFQPQ